jgi:hypothetical protein
MIMTASVARITQEEDAATPATTTAAAEVILHVRFRPDAHVWEIAERPEGLDKEEWYRLLCARAGDRYQTRIGGRGFFRLSRAELDSLKAQAAP